MNFIFNFFSRPLLSFTREFSITAGRTMHLRTHSHQRVKAPQSFNITLTDSEDQLCKLLDGCAKSLTEEMQSKDSVQCRIAGGWVRDKLLASQSNDIDIALNVMGLKFAEHLAIFARKNNVETGTISKIAQNPEQSKHLETATVKIFGIDIDFVNLRSEEYAESSRIPSMVPGTPLQDAERRDLTINALFYNIHTRSVEDFTTQGMADLRDGIIRTPLPPKQTFLDDPLRILRCIRFASRLGFELVPELKDAAQDLEIQHALVTKVSRERVGEEISKMMKGPDPLRSVALIHELRLFAPIFSTIPAGITFNSKPATYSSSLAAAAVLRVLLHPAGLLPPLHPALLFALESDPSCRARLFLASALTPFLGISYQGKKNKTLQAVEIAIRESLKLGIQNHYLDGIPCLFESAEIFKDFVSRRDTTNKDLERVVIGKILRNKAVHHPSSGLHWTSSLLFSLVEELAPLYNVEEDRLDADTATQVIESYNSFVKRIEELSLSEIGDARPILDGKQIIRTMAASQGPWIGRVQERVVEWQLAYPDKTAAECMEWLKSDKESIRICHGEDILEPTSKRPRRK